MTRFSTAFSSDPQGRAAATALARHVEADLGGPDRVAGALLLSTAAAGDEGPEIGAELAARWPEAGLIGTSFEGVLAEGRVWRDRPAFALLAWSTEEADPETLEPVSILIDPPLASRSEPAFGDAMTAEILSATHRNRLDPEDLLLVFPDAHSASPIEAILPRLRSALGEVLIAGAAASGVDGAPALVWADGQTAPAGGLACLWIPGGARHGQTGKASVLTAGGSRRASDWLSITECRSRWVDELAGAPAIQALHETLRIPAREALEPQLARVLAQLRTRAREPVRGAESSAARDLDRDFEEERYIVGLDPGRGAFSLPTDVNRGQELALAFPDAAFARQALKLALENLEGGPVLLQFACRARDESLHGDPDLEPAWVAAHAPGRSVIGTVAPFQIGPGTAGPSRLQVHSTVLAALRPG